MAAFQIADAMNLVDEKIHVAAQVSEGVFHALDEEGIKLVCVGTEIDASEFIHVMAQAHEKSVLAIAMAGMPLEAALDALFFESFLGGYLYCEKRMRELEAELKERMETTNWDSDERSE